jgi:hypothetical protein
MPAMLLHGSWRCYSARQGAASRDTTRHGPASAENPQMRLRAYQGPPKVAAQITEEMYTGACHLAVVRPPRGLHTWQSGKDRPKEVGACRQPSKPFIVACRPRSLPTCALQTARMVGVALCLDRNHKEHEGHEQGQGKGPAMGLAGLARLPAPEYPAKAPLPYGTTLAVDPSPRTHPRSATRAPSPRCSPTGQLAMLLLARRKGRWLGWLGRE